MSILLLQSFQGENAATDQEGRGEVEGVSKQSESSKECCEFILISAIIFLMTIE